MLLGNKFNKDDIKNYIATHSDLLNMWDGWFYIPYIPLDRNESPMPTFTTTVFGIKEHYLEFPEDFYIVNETCNVYTNFNKARKIDFNVLPEKMVFELIDYYIAEYEKYKLKAEEKRKEYYEKQKLNTINAYFEDEPKKSDLPVGMIPFTIIV